MSFVKHIHSFPLILILALASLWYFIPDKAALYGCERVKEFEAFQLAEAAIIKQEEHSIRIEKVSSEYDILYSLNGGGDFKVLNDDALTFSELSNAKIELKSTAIRWKHPESGLPFFTNLVIVANKKGTSEYSNTKIFNHPSSFDSKLDAVCITINESDLFDWSKGAMIYGKSSEEDEGFYKEWWYRSANFTERGKTWKKKVNFQFFQNSAMVLNQDCGFKISGNASRYFPQKSMKLYANKDYGTKNFKYNFWKNQGIKKSKTLLLRNSGNDNSRTMFCDLALQNLAAKSNLLTQKGKPVHVFLNGRYWGIYNLRERIDQNFVAQKENCQKEDVTILYCEVYGDRSILRDGSSKEKEKFDRLIESLPKQEALDKGSYGRIGTEIDLLSFTDYIIFETYYANNDWLHNNVTWYKVKGGKWKWILNDLDVTLTYPGDQNLKVNMFEKLKNSSSYTSILFSALISNVDFKNKFKKRVKQILSTHLSENSINREFKKMRSEYEEDIHYQIKRWRGISNMDIWESNVDENLEFLLNRKAIYLEQVNSL
ncbi:MAG: CotH kinase family protein [Crocinitomicaceae bacterium]